MEQRLITKIWNIVYPVLLYYVARSICVMTYAYFFQWITAREGMLGNLGAGLQQHSVVASAVVNGLSMMFGVAVVLPLFKKENVQIRMPKGKEKYIPVIFLAGALAALFFNVLFSFLQITGSSQSYAEVADRQFALPLWMGLILYGVISPIAEEVVFRGIVYNGLCRYFGQVVAITGSALFFGMYHGNMVQALYGFIMGLLMAVFYMRYGSFIVPVVFHSAANICIYVISCLGQYS